MLTKSYNILSRNGSSFSSCKQTSFLWKQSTASELWFLHPTNQLSSYQMTGSKCHNCRNGILVHSLWNPLTFPFSKTVSVRRSSDKTEFHSLLPQLVAWGRASFCKHVKLRLKKHFKHLFWVKVDLDASLWDKWHLTFGTKRTATVILLKDQVLRLISYHILLTRTGLTSYCCH